MNVKYSDFSEADRKWSADRVSEMAKDRELDLLEACMAMSDELKLGALQGEDARAFRIFMLGMGEMLGPVRG